MWINYFIETVFSFGVFMNAVLFIPQIFRILREKSAQGLSLLMFIGFWLIQLVTVLHGLLKHDYLLVMGFGLSLLTCGTVIFLIIFYRTGHKIP